jgi:hypothetical protein
MAKLVFVSRATRQNSFMKHAKRERKKIWGGWGPVRGTAHCYYYYCYYYYYYYYDHHHHRISHFSASSGKHSRILGYVINRNRLGGLICNLKSFLQLNMFQELQIFAFVYRYWDAG